MNISCQVIPSEDGFQYNYVMPIQAESGAKLTPVFTSNFGNPNLFTQVGDGEFAFTGQFSYSPNNLKAFGFLTNLPPTDGQIILRAVSPMSRDDYSVTAPVPVPESVWLIPFALLGMGLLTRNRVRSAASAAFGISR